MPVQMKICWPVYIIFQLLYLGVSAQSQIAGKIKGNSEILVSATIQNISQQTINISDLGGNYRIAADAGDTLIFSYQGYITDTIIVDSFMFSERLPVELKMKISYLRSVDVDEMAKYRQDSLSRREDYDYIFNKKGAKPLWDKNLSGDGHAANLSPLGHWSSDEKQKKRLKERLERDDKEEYIYYKFSRRVPKLTGLTGDSLISFIIKYKPTYEYCQRATSLDMLTYINDKLILFKKKNVK